MLRFLAWIFFFLIFCFTVVLTARNDQRVVLDYYVNHLEIDLVVLLLITLGIGISLGIIFNLMWVWNLRRDNQRLKKRLKSTNPA